MRVLLSIKPEFVEKIFNGEKKYEYRKCIFKKNDIDTIVVYSTKPEGKIVGELKIESILKDKIDDLWEETKDFAGIDYEYYKQYFETKEEGYAIKIKDIIKYEEPISPFLSDENFKAPQSFMYVS
ncbi:ASCH domain-containing protein [Halobacillus salinarum]|uniref:ASCH domain-containing protein n=1 Tax=Halobacillus salinarum TaxID=2932257 RepID=A0ABY4EHN7_9BACI|nr:ASCH domain-containing protein [Halobacillus salinarum]UOQ43398.1 ASCH domain-containing protein [Halobacillus salinarum]